MITVYRYKTMKTRDGKIDFTYHRDGTIIGFTETWHPENGWEVAIDVLVDTTVPVERRRFFLCTGGDNLSALGENAFAYHVGTHENKGYISYLFDISHLAEQVVAGLEANWGRLQRKAPDKDQMSYRTRVFEEREARRKERERVEQGRRENAERQARRLANERAATDALVESRGAADAERERIAEEGSHLRIVEEA